LREAFRLRVPGGAGIVRLALAALLLAAAAAAGAQPITAREHEVKAAYLLKFPAFIEWPQHEAQAEAPFRYAVVGAPAIASELARLAEGRQVAGRPIEVREVAPEGSVRGADVVFVGAAAGALGRIAGGLADAAVLIVGESAGALDDGAVLNFVLLENRVRFQISAAAAEARGLRVSPRLLALAVNVRPGKL